MNIFIAMNNELLIQQLDTASYKRIGMVTLNKESSLNALSLEMARDLKALLEQWREDDQIACVFLQGAGNKALLCRWRYSTDVLVCG